MSCFGTEKAIPSEEELNDYLRDMRSQRIAAHLHDDINEHQARRTPLVT